MPTITVGYSGRTFWCTTALYLRHLDDGDEAYADLQVALALRIVADRARIHALNCISDNHNER